jgi:hypothetical protein
MRMPSNVHYLRHRDWICEVLVNWFKCLSTDISNKFLCRYVSVYQQYRWQSLQICTSLVLNALSLCSSFSPHLSLVARQHAVHFLKLQHPQQAPPLCSQHFIIWTSHYSHWCDDLCLIVTSSIVILNRKKQAPRFT